MGSGVLLAALVVLWFVVLVPMVVTRGDSSAVPSTGADAGRTLQRRRTVDPAVFAETERVSIDRAALLTSGELRVDVHAVRRRTLAGLLALTLLALVGALVWSPWLWIAQGVLDVAVVAYLMVLRAVARRERLAARRAARAAARSVRQPAAEESPRVTTIGTSTTNHSTTSAASSTPDPIENTTRHTSHLPRQVMRRTPLGRGRRAACRRSVV